MDWWIVAGVVLALVIGAAIVHVVLTIADRRGLVWYRNPDRPPPKTLGLVEEIYQPSVEHVIEADATEATEADQDPSGEPERRGDGTIP